jgi:hypothetical protein
LSGRRTALLGTLVAALAGGLPALAQSPAGSGETTEYYLGEVKTLSPAGQTLATSLSLARRTLQPAENRIVEVVATIEAGKPVREFTTVFEVSGAKFTIKDDGGTFAGTGELAGEPWRWSGWRYEVQFTGARQGTMKGEDAKGPAGLTVTKSFATPDGTVRVRFAEELKPIGADAYRILRAKLVTDAKP